MVAAASSATGSRRRSVRSRLSVTPIARSPVLFEFTDHTVRIGYVGDARPKHVVPTPPHPPPTFADAATWYRYLAPFLQQLYQTLIQDPTNRRLIVLFSIQQLGAWQQALLQCAWDANIPALSCISAYETIPMAFPSLKDLLVIYISSQQACCLAHAAGQNLLYTFQSVPAGYMQAVKEEKKEENNNIRLKTGNEWSEHMMYTWLNPNNPESIIVAILKCLQACPRSIRKAVLANLVLVGEAIVYRPDLTIRIAQQLQRLLKNETTDDDRSDTEQVLHEPETRLTQVPIAWKELEPLADSIGVVETAPYRADLVAWAGASVWASHVHGLDPDDARFQWTKKPE